MCQRSNDDKANKLHAALMLWQWFRDHPGELRIWREVLGLSQPAMVQEIIKKQEEPHIGLDVRTYQRWEWGEERQPHPRNLLALLEVFKERWTVGYALWLHNDDELHLGGESLPRSDIGLFPRVKRED